MRILSILKKIHLVIIFLALISAIISCAPTAGIKVVSYPSEKVIKNSLIVASKIKITDIRKDIVNELLRVQITAKNKRDQDFQFEYRFRWLDAKGFEVRTPLSTWNSIYSIAKDNINMSATAPNKDITDFEFVVRFPDRW